MPLNTVCRIRCERHIRHLKWRNDKINEFPFFLGPQKEKEDTTSTQQLSLGLDISYSVRHVEESWHHLIRSGDTQKLKEIAVCNFDFLLAAVSIWIIHNLSSCLPLRHSYFSFVVYTYCMYMHARTESTYNM